MATTKIWAIKDSLSRVVNYAKNPEKTIFSDLKQVLKYAENDEKTIDKNEKTMYVTGVNCNKETAYEEMTSVQNRFDKCTGNIAYHAYQSFKTGEVSPELAHKIGVELAEKMWSEHQVIVTTHFNTGTDHNHFVINSVNMFTGKKFNCNKGAYYHFRELSDELCREYRLTVIEKPKGKTPRNIYFAEKRGEPTKYNLMRQAMDEAMEICVSYSQFKKVMYKKGYIINDDNNRKYPTIRSMNDKKAVRMYQLGEKYLPKNIAERVFQNPCYVQEEYYKLIKPKKSYTKYKVYEYKGNLKNISKMSGIDVLFILLFHLLGLIPKRENYKPLSPEMKQEVRKMQRYSNEIRLIVTEKLKTLDDVIKDELPSAKIGVLTGPSHAEEVAISIPTVLVIASEHEEILPLIQDTFMSKNMRIYTSTDVKGLELGGALKNIIAFCAGVAAGIGLGDNSFAALITRGLGEISRLGVKLGGKQETFYGLSGLGDLIVTCLSEHSRNRRAGKLIGQGKTLEETRKEVGMVIESIDNIDVAYELGKRNNIYMPIIETVYDVIYNGLDPKKAVEDLMTREKKSEI